MHRVGDQVADAVEDCPVAGEARQPEELLGHDRQGKVPGAARGTGVADMLRRCRRGFRAPRGASGASRSRACASIGPARSRHRRSAVPRRVVRVLGRPATLISTARSRGARGTPPAPARTRRNSPMPPQTLKLTQVSVGKWNAMYQLANAMAAKNADPRPGDARPDGGGSVDVLHHEGEQVAPPDQLAGGENRAECQVEHRRLPFDECLVLQDQRRAAEHDDDRERQPVDGGHLAAPVEPRDLQRSTPRWQPPWRPRCPAT